MIRCGAFASVNHLHLHLLHLERKLYVEDANLVPLGNGVYKLDSGYPANGFCFPIESESAEISNRVIKLVNYLCLNNIPHNLFFTLGNFNEKDVMKIFVYPRTKASTTKEFDYFNVAFCELSGYVPVGSEAVYQSLTEESIIKKINGDIGNVTEEIELDVRNLYKNL